MKTEIARFCATLLPLLRSLPPAVAELREQLRERSALAAPSAVLAEVGARLRALTGKLANPHAYLLIFGPLKSGKSTLMNAVSGAYVSEVTSLPGYPALVFVQHAERPAVSVTRYNERESVFADLHVLKDVIADSHLALALHIRGAEEQGEAFDPRRHFSEAIRRIDIKMPVPALAESGTVLVDTPGLYSRMNFGYDVLTREFRNTAACAVFVVKADNLFLEQVFTEFNQLLDLFTRIFLVVNVDSGKRDLKPDGTLTPSAESADPQRIVEAFKALSMAGPLRAAHEQGRVRIHAVDLLQAAAEVLARATRGEPAAEARGEAYGALQRDLTDYLNSTDYTREFIRDSLRQSHRLCDEVVEVCAGPEVSGWRVAQDAQAAELAALEARLATFDRLLAVDWRGTFGQVRVVQVRRIVRASEGWVEELRASLEVALERWYESAHGLRSLEHQYWNPIVRQAGAALAGEAAKNLRKVLATPWGGASPEDAVLEDLRAVGFDLAPAAEAAAKTLATVESSEPYRIPIQAEEVPVRKALADWAGLRSGSSVSVRLFGEDRLRAIAPEEKRQRLSDPSRIAFLRAIENGLTERFPELPSRAARQQLERYIERFCEGVKAGLEERRAQVERRRAEKQGPHDANLQVVATLKTVSELALGARSQVSALAEREQVRLLAPAPAEPLVFPVVEAPPQPRVHEGSKA